MAIITIRLYDNIQKSLRKPDIFVIPFSTLVADHVPEHPIRFTSMVIHRYPSGGFGIRTIWEMIENKKAADYRSRYLELLSFVHPGSVTGNDGDDVLMTIPLSSAGRVERWFTDALRYSPSGAFVPVSVWHGDIPVWGIFHVPVRSEDEEKGVSGGQTGYPILLIRPGGHPVSRIPNPTQLSSWDVLEDLDLLVFSFSGMIYHTSISSFLSGHPVWSIQSPDFMEKSIRTLWKEGFYG